MLFKATVINTFGPFCGMGGYGSVRGVGFSKSPKKAFQKAKKAVRGRDAGGGVPVLQTRLLQHGHKTLHEVHD